MDKYKKYPVPTKAKPEDQIKYMIASQEREIAELKADRQEWKKSAFEYAQKVKDLKDKLHSRNQIIQEKSNELCKLITLRNEFNNKLHRRNMQIKDLKIALKIEGELKDRFNKKICDIGDALEVYSPNIIALSVRIRNVIDR